MEEINNDQDNLNKVDYESIVRDSLAKIKKIDTLYKKIFEGEETESIAKEIEETLISIKEKYEHLLGQDEKGQTLFGNLNLKIEEIGRYHEELVLDDNSIKSSVEAAQKGIADFFIFLFGDEEIKGKESEVKIAIEKIINFHGELTSEKGYENLVTTAVNRIKKLDSELFDIAETETQSKVDKLTESIDTISEFREKIEKEINPLIEETKKEIKTKSNEIGSLLSNATAKTLGEGYLESMQRHGFIGLKNNKIDNVTIFKWLNINFSNFINYLLFIGPLLLIGFIFIEPNFVNEFLNIQELGGSKLDGFEYLIYKISLSIPLLWISWYGQRNISHRKRLFEEYNHKLRVVQMYLLFISEENSYTLDKKEELEKILLEVIKRNPSEVYGKDETMLDKLNDLIKSYRGIDDNKEKEEKEN